MTLLGIDVGTTGCKALAVGPDGSIVGRAYREYSLETPAPGWAQLDASEVWAAISGAAREVCREVPDAIAAVAISAAGEVALPVAGDGRALGPAIVSLDTRALPQFEWLVERVGVGKLTDFGGFEPAPHHTITRWLWLREEAPELYNSARWLLGWMELICVRLGLPPTTDRSLAVRSLGFDLQQGSWDAEFLAGLGLDSEKLPNVVASGTLIGHAQGAGCDDLGLEAGVAVVAGGLDQLCAAYGLGIRRRSAAMLSLGTTGVLAACVNSGEVDASLPHVPFVGAETELVIGGTPAGGAMLRWFRDEFGGHESAAGDDDRYDALLGHVDDVATSVLVLPHLGGSRVAFGDPKATGAITGLTFGTRRVELIRAALDGVAYELATMRDRFAERGVPVPALVAAGGGSKSSAWMQIVSDAMDLELRSTRSGDVAAYGAARLASAGLGQELAPLEPLESFTPRADWVDYHAARREVFVATYERLQRSRAAQPDRQRAGAFS